MSVSDFLAAEIADCKARGISVVLHPSFTLKCGGLETTGWFDEESLQVAIDRPFSDWFAVFVHESCHKDQFVEKAPSWDTKIGTYDTSDILDMWLERVIELSPEQMNTVIEKVQGVEIDCEKRAAEKIRAQGLPLDIDLYIKKANAYLWFYRTLPLTRKWYVAPYNNPKLLETMPTQFVADYTTPPPGFLEIIQAAAP